MDNDDAPKSLNDNCNLLPLDKGSNKEADLKLEPDNLMTASSFDVKQGIQSVHIEDSSAVSPQIGAADGSVTTSKSCIKTGEVQLQGENEMSQSGLPQEKNLDLSASVPVEKTLKRNDDERPHRKMEDLSGEKDVSVSTERKADPDDKENCVISDSSKGVASVTSDVRTENVTCTEGENTDSTDTESVDSNSTIIMDDDLIEKAVGKVAEKQTHGEASSTKMESEIGHVSVGGDFCVDEEQMHTDTVDKGQPHVGEKSGLRDIKELTEEQCSDSEMTMSKKEFNTGQPVKQKEEDSPRLRNMLDRKKPVPDTSPDGKGTTKKESQGKEAFGSLDLPIYPVHDARRSRKRWRSNELPLERPPSIASNRSEDSSSSGKQRKKEGSLTEAHRERKKSGAPTKVTGSLLRVGFDFRPGFRMEAMDYSKKWYPARIVQVNEEEGEVCIHFEGWNARFDEWVDYKSDRLRPSMRPTRRDGSPETAFNVGDTVLARWSDTRYYQGKIRGINANGSYRVRFYDGLEKSVQAGNIREMPEELRPIVSPKGYGIGDEVLARWNDCRYYPAKILSIKKNGAFRVLFYDGIEKSVQPFNVREMSAELKAQDFFKPFKEQIKASEEKNRKKRERAREAEEGSTPAASSSVHAPKRRLLSDISLPKKAGHHPKKASPDSSDSTGIKLGRTQTGLKGYDSPAAEEESQPRRVSTTPPISPKSEQLMTQNTSVTKSKSEAEFCKVVLKRGMGYYINGFIYIKNCDSVSSLILRCQYRHHCGAKAIIVKKTGKAIVKQGRHTHKPPNPEDIEFCTDDPENDSIPPSQRSSKQKQALSALSSTPAVQEGSTTDVPIAADQLPSPTTSTEASIIPVSQLFSAEELEKMKERKKRIREPLHAPKELIIDLDHNKYKCEVLECGKSFRKATLLEYHKKYYHNKQSSAGVAAAATKVLNKSRKRLSTSPTKSSRRSSEELGSPAKITRSQRFSAPSDLGIVLPTRESISPSALGSPKERKSLPADVHRREKTRHKSSDKLSEIRFAKTPGEVKGSKIPETRIPRSPEGRLARSSDGKLMKTPEGRSSRSSSVESRSARSSESKSSPASERRRQLSGMAVSKHPDVKGHSDRGSKLADKKPVIESNSSIPKSQEIVTDKDIKKQVDLVAKSLNIIIKQEPEDVIKDENLQELVGESETLGPSRQDKPKGNEVVAVPATVPSVGKLADAEHKVDKESKIRSERAKVKHKKKHKHRHEKGKEVRSRDRHKVVRRRKPSEKTKISETDGKEKSSLAAKKVVTDGSRGDQHMEEKNNMMDSVASIEDVQIIEEEKEIINCVCGYMEEEGFMLQCERCYCWQHGCCEGVNQSTAPKQYVCTFCRHPRGERLHSKYRYDQEWFKTGKVPHFAFVSQENVPDTSQTMLTTHNLMADIDAINDVLYGLQHKMAILRNPNHPELALWAHPWRTGEEWAFDGPSASEAMATSNLDTVSNSVNTSMQSTDALETSIINASNMDTSSNNQIDHVINKCGDASTKCSDVGRQSGNVDTKSGNVDAKSGNVDPKSGNVDAKTGNVDTKSGDVDTKCGDVDTKCGDVGTRIGDVDTKSGNVDTKSGDVDTKSDDVDTKSDDVDINSGDVNTKTGDVGTKCSDVNKTDGERTKSSDVDQKSGEDCTKGGGDCTKDISTESGVVDEDDSVSKENVSTKCDDVSTKCDDVSTICNDVSTKSDDISTKCDDVRTNSGDVSSQSIELTTKSSDVCPQSGDVSTKCVNVGSQGNDSGTAETAIAKTESITKLTDESADIDVNAETGESSTNASHTKTKEGSIKTTENKGTTDSTRTDNLQVVDVTAEDDLADKNMKQGILKEEVPEQVADESPGEENDSVVGGKSLVETSQKPACSSDAKSASESPTSNSDQIPLHVSKGSVFGLQALKTSTSTVYKNSKSETVDPLKKSSQLGASESLPNNYKPGPSGLQQSDDVNRDSLQQLGGLDISGTSGLQVTDCSTPGPSGLHLASGVPSTSSEDVAMETNEVGDGKDCGGSNKQLLSTEVKVIGSSVWTSVQGSSSAADTHSTVCETRGPPIPPPAVCQANLMEHIQTMHEELFDRLALIEEQIEALEIAHAQQHGGLKGMGNEQESLALKRKMAVLMSDLEKLSNIDLTSHN